MPLFSPHAILLSFLWPHYIQIFKEITQYLPHQLKNPLQSGILVSLYWLLISITSNVSCSSSLLVPFMACAHPIYLLIRCQDVNFLFQLAQDASLHVPLIKCSNKHICFFSHAAPYTLQEFSISICKTNSLSSFKFLLKILLCCDAYKKVYSS